VELLQAYLRLNTVNPPGNEIVAAEFFARLLDEAEITNAMAESAPEQVRFPSVAIMPCQWK